MGYAVLSPTGPVRNPICGPRRGPENIVRTTALAILVTLGALGALVGSAGAGTAEDGKGKVPVEADRVLTGVATAFRSGDPDGICERMYGGKDARLHLSLKGVTPGAYTRDQATEALKSQYFAKRRIVSMKPTDECAGCGEWAISRAYVMTYRSGEKDVEAPLVIGLERRKVVGDDYAWYLTAISEG
jgi:hypothetical protein